MKIHNVPTKDEYCYLVANGVVDLFALRYMNGCATNLFGYYTDKVQIWRYKQPTCISRKDLCKTNDW